MNDNKFNVFNTPIWGFILSDQKYQAKDYIDKLLDIETTEKSVRKSNFGGYQTRDNLCEEPIFRELCNSINFLGTNIVKEFNGAPVSVKEMWGNINYKYCSNGAHTHGLVLSGVFYLQIPKQCGNLVFCNPAVRSDGHLIRHSNYSVEPQELACIIFPSWLEHYVEPNLSDDKRISLSFNIGY